MAKALSLIVVFFCSLSITNVSGQISFGLNSGLNLTSLSNDTNEKDRWDAGIGCRIGGFAEKSFGKFGVRLEADYSFVGIKGDFDDKIGLHYISVPVTLFYRPIKRLKFFVGPEINFLLNQRGPDYQLSFGEEDFEKFDYGAHAEIEFIVTAGFGISIRNYFGLQYNGEIPASPMQQTVRLNKLNIFGIGINYYLMQRKESK
jgi:hypothetical protein